ncbi:hypothetical protein [Streptomyces sp. GQFP]|uniref:hypothetical protein n=1 Tax=Streptomyces sp. GQFP TaxID=2907545 RepID=UPI002E1E9BE5
MVQGAQLDADRVEDALRRLVVVAPVPRPLRANHHAQVTLRTERDQAARDQKAKEHDALVECAALGDGAGAAEIMRKHIDTSLGATAVWRLGHADSADLVDKYGDQLRVCDVQFTSYGAVHSFAGPIRTLS